MKNLEAVKLGLASQNQTQQITALSEALKYGDEGLELLIQTLNHESWWLQHRSFLLLRQKPFRSIPWVRQALREYIKADRQYPEDRPEVKAFLANDRPLIENELGQRVGNPALLALLKWGEIIIDSEYATGYRDEGVYFYIVDCQNNTQILKSLKYIPEHAIEIDLKFLSKKGYSYYLTDLNFLGQDYDTTLYLPTFNLNEKLVFCSVGRDVFEEVEEVEEEYDREALEIYVVDTHLFEEAASDRLGELIQEQNNLFILNEEGTLQKLSKVRKFYQIPKQYLKLRGYSYYRKMSQTYQVPLLGYLSPKEYLNLLDFQILDCLSLKPLWSWKSAS